MKSNLLAIIVAVALFVGGFFYLYYGKSSSGEQAPSTDTSQTTSDAPAQNQDTTSTATNYDECIAEGNKPLPDAPDKCLTKDGHLFIQGVVE